MRRTPRTVGAGRHVRTKDDHLTELYGLPAFTFPEERDSAGVTLPEADAVAWRIGYERGTGDERWKDTFERLCAAVDSARIRALIIGIWGDPEDTEPDEVVSAFLDARDRLTGLRSVYFGDITDKECRISRIGQTDVTPLIASCPALEEFSVRAGESYDREGLHPLSFPRLRHDALRRLVVESAGLRGHVLRGVGESELPALEHLELWLGARDDGGDGEIADLAGILSGDRLPRLRSLALRNSEMQDEVAAAVGAAPVVAGLDVLDLSLGTLTDAGAEALLGGQPLTHLRKLDLHHNYLSEPMRQRVRNALEPAGVEVDLDPSDAETEVDGDGVPVPSISVGPLTY
ncbi:STM4015 family protein [Streptomyces olivaceus]|uniref:STM4015 family protein n=1 Tax=Streptomyces olivaceus TaxID=47716 RepID=UPI0021E18DB0|nr:STM4015 family protein [Streptomyces olivaceus]